MIGLIFQKCPQFQQGCKPVLNASWKSTESPAFDLFCICVDEEKRYYNMLSYFTSII